MDGSSLRPGLLTRERIITDPGYNRWLLLPLPALAIHLSIGMIYGMSVFWLPLSQAIGIVHPLACPAGTPIMARLIAANADWTVADVSIVFTLGIVAFGLSAALLGGWVERAGPRHAGLVAALCWPGGLALAALGVNLPQLWLLWFGGGIVGGIGLGLGYISPVSTLIKWFPDRRGLATGLAISNLLIRPVRRELFSLARTDYPANQVKVSIVAASPAGLMLPLAWLAVGLPLAWGFSVTLTKAAALFR